jgi:glycerophosphoryl diester phosphodiesterase
MKKGLLIAGGLAVLPLFLLAPGQPGRKKKAPFLGRNIAHRGLHTEDKRIPENSLAAFSRAAEEGYGMELDVQLSKDGQVVVFHDDTLDRVCGVHARVDEKTWAELQELRLCGTEYGIPLFSEVLQTVRGRGPLIVELKNGRRNRELCEKTYALLAAYRGDVCVESFNPLIVAWFRFHAPDLQRGQLAEQPAMYAGEGIGRLGGWVLGNTLLNFAARPGFIAYRIGPKTVGVRVAEALGALRVGWTSHSPASEIKRDTVIFEFYRPPVRFK